MGVFRTPSMQGRKYFMTVIDDYSRFYWIFFTRLKSETSFLIKYFVTYIQTQILKKKLSVDQPGLVERKHQHLLGVTYALLFQSKLHKLFWSHDLSHVVYIINRLPSKLLQIHSPFYLLHDK